MRGLSASSPQRAAHFTNLEQALLWQPLPALAAGLSQPTGRPLVGQEQQEQHLQIPRQRDQAQDHVAAERPRHATPMFGRHVPDTVVPGLPTTNLATRPYQYQLRQLWGATSIN